MSLLHVVGPSCQGGIGIQYVCMRKSIGFVIALWGLSQFFTSSFSALDNAASESFRALEAAAITSQATLGGI